MLITLGQAAFLGPEWSMALKEVFDSNNFVPFIIFGVGGMIAIVSIVFTTMKGMLLGRAKERTRQEIAAYVAEGSMSASEGERLVEAGEPIDGKPRAKASPGGTVRVGVFKVEA